MLETHKSKKSSNYRSLKKINRFISVINKKEGASCITTHLQFFSPITLQLLSPEMKSAYPWHTSQEHALTTADTKRAGSPTRSAGCLPSFCLFRAGFSYSVALMPPFCFRRQPFRQAVPPPFQPCRSWSFSRLAFRGWRDSGRNSWRCG